MASVTGLHFAWRPDWHYATNQHGTNRLEVGGEQPPTMPLHLPCRQGVVGRCIKRVYPTTPHHTTRRAHGAAYEAYRHAYTSIADSGGGRWAGVANESEREAKAKAQRGAVKMHRPPAASNSGGNAIVQCAHSSTVGALRASACMTGSRRSNSRQACKQHTHTRQPGEGRERWWERGCTPPMLLGELAALDRAHSVSLGACLQLPAQRVAAHGAQVLRCGASMAAVGRPCAGVRRMAAPPPAMAHGGWHGGGDAKEEGCVHGRGARMNAE